MNNEDNQKDTENVPNVNKEDWKVKDIVEEGSNDDPDDVVRRTLRGDEDNKSTGDSKDVVGSSNSKDTPQGREEAKVEEDNNN